MPEATANTPKMRIVCEEVPLGGTARLTPGKLQKVVHLVRHGQATHNVNALGKLKEGEPCPCMSGKPGCPYMDPEHEDAKLTLKGRLQATQVGPKLVATKPSPQIALVSPLTRTLQTATIGLSTAPQLDHLELVADLRVRERFGLHLCDKRSNKNRVCKYFRRVDFSAIPPGEDPYPSRRETEIEAAVRGKSFFLTLKDRPETSIAIIAHSSLFYNTLSKMFESPNPKAVRRFVTGEVRCLLLTYEEE